MTFFSALYRVLLLTCLGLLLTGCSPLGSSGQDELKDPHFLEGKSRVNSLNYQGAIESFERALQSNPNSAAAHFELGLLHYQKVNNFATAIYHFEKFLKLRPTDPHAGNVGQFVLACKQELARSVNLGPVTQQVQRELERLHGSNAVLVADSTLMKQQLAQQQQFIQQLEQALAQSQAQVQRAAQTPVSTPTPQPLNPVSRQAQPNNVAAQQRAQVLNAQTPTSAGSTQRTHTVRAGESPYSIAKQYNVKLAALLAANPGLDPKKMRPGNVIKLPAP